MINNHMQIDSINKHNELIDMNIVNTQEKGNVSQDNQSDKNLFYNIMRPHKCQKCSSTFDRASQLDYHYRSLHLGERSQVCEICGKGFFRKTDLRTHVNIHLGTNQCICEICGRKFNHVSNLIRHCRTHKGIKPYPCSICGERFTQISSLVRHKRIHTRPQEQCDKNYGNDKKTTKRQYYCRTCGKSFNFYLLLKDHERSHSVTSEQVENRHHKKISEDAQRNICQEENLSGYKNVQAHYNEESKMKDSKGCNFTIDDVLREVQSFETIVYVTSGQFEKMNLEQTEDADYFVQSQLEQESLNADKNSFTYLANDSYIDDMLIQYKATEENSSEKEKHDRCLNINEIGSCTKTIEESFKDTEPSSIDFIEKQSSSINTHSVLDNHDSENREDSFVFGTEHLTKANESDTTQNCEGPTLRLVQTETGEQFYELIINALPERGDDLQENIPEIQMHKEQELQCITDANSEKEIHGTNLLNNDSQIEFERYVRTNLETFEKSNYENSTEQFLKLIEIVDENASYKNCSASNKDEQLCELLRETHIVHGNGFIQHEYVQENILDENDTMELNKNSEEMIQNLLNTESTKAENNTENLQIDFIDDKYTEREQEIKKTKTSKKFQCDVCKKEFAMNYNYKRHIGIHFTDQRSFHCKECGQSFAWKSTLNKHIASNHRPDGPQKFVCEICPKVYSTLSQVNEHVRRDHLKQRNHVCPYCNKSFFKKFDLKTHSRTHTDERPYICRACGKRFHHQSHIIRHERIHSGERPYVCDICQKTFTQPGSLKAHKQKHQRSKLNILDYQIDEDDPVGLVSI